MTAEQISKATGIDQQVLAGFLGMLVAERRITVARWEGTNSKGKQCHLYTGAGDG